MKAFQIESNLTSYKEIKCSRIVGYNLGFDAIMWMLITTTGNILYTSDIYGKQDTWKLELNSLRLLPGTEFKLSYRFSDNPAHVDSSQILIYTPDSNATVYYQHDSNNTNKPLVLNGVVPPIYTTNAEPYLKCSGIHITSNIAALLKYQLYTLGGLLLYESSRQSKGDKLNINFKDIKLITPHMLMKVKACVIAGNDDICDVVFEYIPDSYYEGYLIEDGGTLNNAFIFSGSNTLIPPDSKTIIGNQLIAYNNSNMIAKFAIILLDGTIIYKKDKIIEWDTLLINLEDVNIEPETYVRFKVILMEYDLISKIAIKYSPNTSTAYYSLTGNAGAIDSHKVNYYGALSSETSPPLLKCSSLQAVNNSKMITKWSIYRYSTTIYESGRCRIGRTWTLDLSKLSLEPGTRFILKSNAIAGKDSITFAIIEFDPDILKVAQFEFVGNAFKTLLMYKGIQ